jgi:hypothetical protein
MVHHSTVNIKYPLLNSSVVVLRAMAIWKEEEHLHGRRPS